MEKTRCISLSLSDPRGSVSSPPASLSHYRSEGKSGFRLLSLQGESSAGLHPNIPTVGMTTAQSTPRIQQGKAWGGEHKIPHWFQDPESKRGNIR